MQDDKTLGDLIDLAIQAEQNAESLYCRLSELFTEYQGVAKFWIHYADEETEHALWLQRLRERLGETALAQPADLKTWTRAQHMIGISIDHLLDRVETLQDAWVLANEMEHGETNIVFEFLLDHFAGDTQAQAFMHTQMIRHVSHLIVDFPRQFSSSELRLSIRAKRPGQVEPQGNETK
jgi:hypothetical protein